MRLIRGGSELGLEVQGGQEKVDALAELPDGVFESLELFVAENDGGRLQGGQLRWAQGLAEPAIIITYSPAERRSPYFSIVPHVDIRFPYRHSLW